MKPALLFGTNNHDKLREIRELVSGTHHILSLEELDLQQEVDETESTLEGNAILKAKGYFQLAQVPCFADDTGLEVDALNGAPGVYSARYAGAGGSYQDNVEKLLRELEGVRERQARFRTVIAYFNGYTLITFEGTVEGSITTEARGQQGFGYDPVFLPQESTQTFAEMPLETKNRISHRGRAFRKFADYLLTA